MDNFGYIDKMKIAYKAFSFKLQQRWLKSNETAVVETTYGPVQGVKRTSIYNDDFYSFEGIPFAKPPLGELRFRAPQPPEPWTEIKDCRFEQSIPLQENMIFKGSITGSEDCLYLNVYTKNINPSKPTPVMVWIYGGGFNMGGPSKDLYSPDYLMMENVIIVSITYRVGALGFLSFEDPEVGIPGNAGLKDQVLALKWVKDNCSRFGGDPDNITVFGESAGGASAHIMAITDQTKGLFHKAVLMSGTAIADWVIPPKDKWPFRLAKAIGYTGDQDDKNVFDYLSNAKPEDLIKNSAHVLTDQEKQERILFVFGPRVEPYIGNDCVIPEDPKLMMKKAWTSNIPMLIGGVAFEGLLFTPELKQNKKLFDQLGDGEYFVPWELKLQRDSEECKKLGQSIVTAHFGDKKPSSDATSEYLDILSIKHFWHSVHRTVLSRTQYSTAPTYLYRFDVDTKDFNQFRTLVCGKSARGTCHGDDVSFCFYGTFAYKLSESSFEFKSIKRMVKMLTAFATNGDPNNEHFGDVVFEAAKKGDDDSFKCLNISEEVQFVDLPEKQKLATWDKLYTRDDLY